MFTKHLFGAALMSAVVLPTLMACDGDNPITDAAGDLCCTEFKVGADLTGVDFKVDADIKGQFEVFAQTGSDFSGVATAMLEDVTNACRGIAQDLGAAPAEQDLADKITQPGERVKKWCSLAVASLNASAGGNVKAQLTIEPPSFSCDASIDAKANCQAKCSGTAECDVKVNPPKCTGGTLKVECSGKCTASAEAPTFSCKGKCDVAAKGSCTAQGGVNCQGKCEGTCEGSTDSGGNCQGTCKGSCSAVAPSAKCEGSFEGECQGSCEASPGSAKVECSGKCDVDATPLKCEGGKLEGGCKVEAKCDANCDASVSAKADCNVKPLTIKASASGAANANIDAVIATLKVNLPKLVIAVKARGEALGTIAGSFAGKGTVDLVADPGKLGVKGVACGVAIVATVTQAASNVTDSISAGGSVTGAVGLN